MLKSQIPHTVLSPKPRLRRIPTIVQSFISCRVGSRCVFCQIQSLQFGILGFDEGSRDPIVLARAAYWRGRAFEAAGQFDEMKAQYEMAAHYPTAYYGQLARARLGLSEIALQSPPATVEGT